MNESRIGASGSPENRRRANSIVKVCRLFAIAGRHLQVVMWFFVSNEWCELGIEFKRQTSSPFILESVSTLCFGDEASFFERLDEITIDDLVDIQLADLGSHSGNILLNIFPSLGIRRHIE
jgi:hypothetical protein